MRFFALTIWQQRAAAAVILVIVLKLLFGGDAPPPPAEIGAPKIALTLLQAQPHRRAIVLYGETQPVRDVSLNAQASGQVTALLAKEGAFLRQGEAILQIDPRNRPERLAQAKALMKQREIEYEAARKLQKRGFESAVRLAQAKAALEDARANLKQMQLDSGFLQLTAPFDGLLEVINVEEGDFVGIGTFGVEGAAARMVDLSPLLVKAQLAERDRSEVHIGDEAMARLGDGREAPAIVSYLGNVADGQSRTFAIEAEISNSDFALPAGVTAELTVYGMPRMAYSVSASVLGLNDAGEVGIKRLNDKNKVVFEPVEIIEEGPSHLWIAGLPDTMRLITTGQAYVSAGQVIAPDAIEQEQADASTD